MSDPSYIDELAMYRRQAADTLANPQANPQRFQDLSRLRIEDDPMAGCYERAIIHWWEWPLVAVVLLASGLVWAAGLWLIWVALTIVLS